MRAQQVGAGICPTPWIKRGLPVGAGEGPQRIVITRWSAELLRSHAVPIGSSDSGTRSPRVRGRRRGQAAAPGPTEQAGRGIRCDIGRKASAGPALRTWRVCSPASGVVRASFANVSGSVTDAYNDRNGRVCASDRSRLGRAVPGAAGGPAEGL